MVVAMWVKKEDQSAGSEPDSQSQQPPQSSRSDPELMDSGSRQSRRAQYETRRAVEQQSVTKSKSLSLKSQLKSPFKFLGKTYCGGCKVRHIPPTLSFRRPSGHNNVHMR